jgi:hypothetical protein
MRLKERDFLETNAGLCEPSTISEDKLEESERVLNVE